jgi:hypothetical protein
MQHRMQRRTHKVGQFAAVLLGMSAIGSDAYSDDDYQVLQNEVQALGRRTSCALS